MHIYSNNWGVECRGFVHAFTRRKIYAFGWKKMDQRLADCIIARRCFDTKKIRFMHSDLARYYYNTTRVPSRYLTQMDILISSPHSRN